MTALRPAILPALIGGACLVLAACSGGATGAAGGTGVPRGGAAAVPAAAPPENVAGGSARTRLARLPGGQSIIYTARLTVRASDVRDAAARAARLAAAAGGYLAGEDASSKGGPGGATVSIELKIPVAAYQQTLSALSRLGRTLSQSQHARDVTQTVADVNSRVASARAAIAQLRALLARAGSVSSLLAVQDRINAEESSLESLQAQQRALGRQTAYATISLLLVSPHPAGVKHHHKGAGGFVGGLGAGWRALRAVVSWLLTGAGAVLPFLLPAAVLALAGYAAMRWRVRRRAGARPAG